MKITRRLFIGLGGATAVATAIALGRGKLPQLNSVGDVATAAPATSGWGIPWGVGGWDIGLPSAYPTPTPTPALVFLPVVAK